MTYEDETGRWNSVRKMAEKKQEDETDEVRHRRKGDADDGSNSS